ncbi:hypothetical protein SLEP1_g52395 [Rubroshorea leprosula]|uniref:Uncharacterized protein n=1 Tax=Rubroshorea leprosula TaxID=152421 RepID=A0AAV5M682_9ROSI|nr:hypothetical protein SLEP1_g52395 [Rubroshorea leprosula]
MRIQGLLKKVFTDDNEDSRIGRVLAGGRMEVCVQMEMVIVQGSKIVIFPWILKLSLRTFLHFQAYHTQRVFSICCYYHPCSVLGKLTSPFRFHLNLILST